MVQDWLQLLCKFLPNVTRALVVRSNGRGVMTAWPESQQEAEDFAALIARALRAGAAQSDTSGGAKPRLVLPMRAKGLVYAVLALEFDLPARQFSGVQPLAEWAVSWLEVSVGEVRAQSGQLEKLLELLEQCAKQANLNDGSAILTASLASAYGLPRVLVVAQKNDRMEVVASSEGTQVDRRTTLFGAIEAYLNAHLNANGDEEAHANFITLCALLSKHSPAQHPEFFAISGGDRACAHLIVLHDKDRPLTQAQKAQINLLCRQLAPIYRTWVADNHDWSWRLKRRIGNAFAGKRRFYWAAAALVMLAFVTLKIPYKVSAKAQLEGRIQQAIAAPVDGFLSEAFSKAGDTIVEGTTLARLDDQTIRLEIQRWESEKQEFQRQYNREFNELDAVQMRIAEAKVRQAEAQLAIHRQELRRVNIVAPIDGVIIQGDLSRAIGSPVKKGQVLYEMAPAGEFKLVIWVSESDIHLIESEQRGEMLLSAFPQQPIEFIVTRVSALFDERDSAIVYRVEAQLPQTPLMLRPGLSGIAKIATAKRSLAWIVGRRALTWLRLKLWSL